MKVLHFLYRGEWYKVKENGDMLQELNTYNEWNEDWRFLGVSFHHWRRGMDLTVKESFKHPNKMVGGLVWDIDHGTIRQWLGSFYGKLPRVSSAYVDTIK